MDRSTIRWAIVTAVVFALVIWATIGTLRPNVGHVQIFRAL
jgi:hypothetical protein